MQAQIGTIIRGTHRLQDLLPAFVSEMKSLGLDVANFPDLSLDDEDPFWGTDEARGWLEHAEDCLSNVVPPLCDFGTHEGDGSDFGFWPDWGYIEDGARWGEVARLSDPVELDDVARGIDDALVTNHHRNTTYYTRTEDGWAEVWRILTARESG